MAPSEASKEQLYKAVVMSVRDIMLEKRQKFHIETKAKKAKRVYYLCMEFLMGRSLKNSVFNLGVKEAFDGALKQYGMTLPELYLSLIHIFRQSPVPLGIRVRQTRSIRICIL